MLPVSIIWVKFLICARSAWEQQSKGFHYERRPVSSVAYIFWYEDDAKDSNRLYIYKNTYQSSSSQTKFGLISHTRNFSWPQKRSPLKNIIRTYWEHQTISLYPRTYTRNHQYQKTTYFESITNNTFTILQIATCHPPVIK